MSYLNQMNFPRLWLFFQHLVGGTKNKRRLATEYYQGQKKILEIGCSVGNVSEVFAQFAPAEFLGIDIDGNAIDFAKARLKLFSNLNFKNISLSDLAQTGGKFDYVLFANILHHVDDNLAKKLLEGVQQLLAPGATLVIMEPEKIREDYNFAFRFFYKLEQGGYRRHRDELAEIISTAGLAIENCQEVTVAPDLFPFLKVGRITLFKIRASRPDIVPS